MNIILLYITINWIFIYYFKFSNLEWSYISNPYKRIIPKNVCENDLNNTVFWLLVFWSSISLRKKNGNRIWDIKIYSKQIISSINEIKWIYLTKIDNKGQSWQLWHFWKSSFFPIWDFLYQISNVNSVNYSKTACFSYHSCCWYH